MTKIEAMKKHIALREQFWQIKFNPFQYAYGMFRMCFYKQELIESANKGVERHIAEFGNATVLRNKIEGRK